jgi:D-glycero-D-manno-heptose 1,7-bisphosphate phosphatase
VTDQTLRRPAVFLDRDGTLIEDPGYLADPAQVRLLPGVADALVALERAGYLRIIITNQSGIGRGHYPPGAFEATQRELERQLREGSATIDATYCCPHAPDAGCLCRKPGTALHREAIAAFDVDIARSWCVGDQLRDLEPAVELGCQAMLVRCGHGAGHVAAAAAMAAAVADDLAAGSAVLSRYI